MMFEIVNMDMKIDFVSGVKLRNWFAIHALCHVHEWMQ